MRNLAFFRTILLSFIGIVLTSRWALANKTQSDSCFIYEISWSVKEVPNIEFVDIYYSPNENKDWTIVAHALSNDGKFLWAVPETMPAKGKVKVIGYVASAEATPIEMKSEVKKSVFKSSSVEPQIYDLSRYSGEASGTDWPMFQRDAQHTGYTPDALYPPLKLKWKIKADGNWDSFCSLSPVVTNGVVYIGNGLNYLQSLDAFTGQLIWRVPLTSNTGDAAVDDSMIFIGTSIEPTLTYSTFFALRLPNGTSKWTYLTGTVRGEAYMDRSVYFGNSMKQNIGTFHNLLGVNGSPMWTFDIDSAIITEPPAIYDGKVYINLDIGFNPASSRSGLYVFDKDSGDSLWMISTKSVMFSAPTIFSGSVYVGAGTGKLYAIDAITGEERWSKQFSGVGISSSPAAYKNNIYVGTASPYNVNSGFYALNAWDGSIVWTCDLGGSVFSSPAISSNEIAWVGTNQNELCGVDIQTGEIIYRTYLSEDRPHGTGSPAIYNNMLFIASGDGYLYAFEGSDVSLNFPAVLLANCPTPFSSETKIYYQIRDNQNIPVKIRIYNIIGEKILTLVNEPKSSGLYTAVWNGRDSRGKKVSSGVYFCQLKIGDFTTTQKMVVLR